MNVSFCLSAVYGSLFLFSLLSTVECGGALHSVNHLLGPPVGSTPLRKLWATVQRVATSMRQITDRRCGSAPTRAYLKFLISRSANFSPTNKDSRLADSWTASHRHVAAAASLAQRHVDVSVVSFGPCHPARSSGTSGAPPRSVGSNPSPGGHPPGSVWDPGR
jgi:hypothetical protein